MELDETASVSEKLTALESFGTGYRAIDNPIFETNNRELFKPFVRLGVYRYDEEDLCHKSNSVQCNIFHCKQRFDTVFAYESHYNALHRFLCAQCSKNLPSAHLLDLHLSEKHDSFFAVLSERQPMYRCYLEECKVKSKTPIERRDHCITKHTFPHDFRFDCNHGPKTSNEKGKKKSFSNDEKPHSSTTLIQPSKLLAEGGNDEDIELENKSILLTAERKQFKNFRFGNRKAKPTFYNNSTDYAKLLASKSDNSKETKKSSTLESDQAFDDLMESLPQ